MLVESALGLEEDGAHTLSTALRAIQVWCSIFLLSQSICLEQSLRVTMGGDCLRSLVPSWPGAGRSLGELHSTPSGRKDSCSHPHMLAGGLTRE